MLVRVTHSRGGEADEHLTFLRVVEVDPLDLPFRPGLPEHRGIRLQSDSPCIIGPARAGMPQEMLGLRGPTLRRRTGGPFPDAIALLQGLVLLRHRR